MENLKETIGQYTEWKERLEKQLDEALIDGDYEEAAIIQERIDEIKDILLMIRREASRNEEVRLGETVVPLDELGEVIKDAAEDVKEVLEEHFGDISGILIKFR